MQGQYQAKSTFRQQLFFGLEPGWTFWQNPFFIGSNYVFGLFLKYTGKRLYEIFFTMRAIFP